MPFDMEMKDIARSDLVAIDAVLGFDDQPNSPFRFLSNFFPSPIEMYGISFPTVEHAFAAAKLDPYAGVHPIEDVWIEMRKISKAPTPAKAKGMGRRRTWDGRPFMRADWDQVKLDLIYRLLQRKFEHAHLRKMLLDTGDRPLWELTTRWKDQVWGAIEVGDRIIGRNLLGQMLMKLRAEIRASITEQHPVFTEVVEAQVLFDYAVAHIVRQGRPSVATENRHPFVKGKCLYRSNAASPDDPASLSCAVGCLMTDEEARLVDYPYYDDDETTAVNTLSVYGLLPSRLDIHLDLLEALQDAHDGASLDEDKQINPPDVFLKGFLSAAQTISQRYGLTMPELS